MSQSGVPFAVYDTYGAVLRVGSCSESDAPLQANAGEFVLIGEDVLQSESYIDPVTFAVTPLHEFAIEFATVPSGSDFVVTATNIPPHTAITINEVGPLIIEDGIAVVTFDTDGLYDWVCMAPTYLDKTYSVEIE